jgi:peptidoglycan L-alanyl-D-glutamate endopeptidase CwlK
MIPDPVSDKKLTFVYPDLSHRWQAVRQVMWNNFELQIRVTCSYRTYQDQMAIYAQGRRKGPSGAWYIEEPKKIVTHARPGESFHNFGLAIDSCFMGDDPYLEKHEFGKDMWRAFGKTGKNIDLTWGGDFKSFPDQPHLEMSYGLSLGNAQTLFNNGGIKAIFNYCDNASMCGGEIK